jgi:hypothetical protein
VLVSARYSPDGRRLEQVRGFARQGAVWSDQRLFGRDELIGLIRSGKRVAIGKPAGLEGDLLVGPRVRLSSDGPEAEWLAVNRGRVDRDELLLPLF